MRTRIAIDYTRCGDGKGVDPRECGRCLRICGPAVFLLHQTVGAREPDPYDPQMWRVTPMWPTLCTRCGACVEVCPEGAIKVRPSPARAPAAVPGPAAPGHSAPGQVIPAPVPALAEEADA